MQNLTGLGKPRARDFDEIYKWYSGERLGLF